MQLVVCGAAIASHSHYSRPLKDEEKKKTCHLGCGSLHVPPPPPPTPLFFYFPSFSFFYLFKGFSSLLSILPFGQLREVKVSLPSCKGCLSPICGVFLFILCGFFFLLQVVDVLDLEPLTQIQTLGVFFGLDLVCPVQNLAFLFLGFQIYYFFYSDPDLVLLWCGSSSNVRIVPNLTKYCRLPDSSLISIQMLYSDCCLSAHDSCHRQLLLQLLCRVCFLYLF